MAEYKRTDKSFKFKGSRVRPEAVKTPQMQTEVKSDEGLARPGKELPRLERSITSDTKAGRRAQGREGGTVPSVSRGVRTERPCQEGGVPCASGPAAGHVPSPLPQDRAQHHDRCPRNDS